MMISRRTVQFVLGALWFLDGILQLQPLMFSNQFITSMILPMAQSQPAWIAQSIQWAARWVTPHEWVYNCLFASIQLVIGFWLMANFRVKTALVASLAWTLVVWWFGEGFGQLATGQALLLTGAPGSVVLYTVIGWVIWPRRQIDTQMDAHEGTSAAANGAKRPIDACGHRIARYALGILWLLGAVLQAQPAYRQGFSLSQAFVAGWASQLVQHASPSVNLVLILIQLAIAIAFFAKLPMRATASVSIVLSFLFWWTGQGFGQILTGMATDLNSGPLMILLSLCAYANLDHAPSHIRAVLHNLAARRPRMSRAEILNFQARNDSDASAGSTRAGALFTK